MTFSSCIDLDDRDICAGHPVRVDARSHIALDHTDPDVARPRLRGLKDEACLPGPRRSHEIHAENVMVFQERPVFPGRKVDWHSGPG